MGVCNGGELAMPYAWKRLVSGRGISSGKHGLVQRLEAEEERTSNRDTDKQASSVRTGPSIRSCQPTRLDHNSAIGLP